jgi:hypothetical protein
MNLFWSYTVLDQASAGSTALADGPALEGPVQPLEQVAQVD